MTNLIAHVEIPVTDLDRAMDFYRRMLGVHFCDIIDIHGNRMAFFPFEEGQDGASGALAQGDVYVPTIHGAIVYLMVASIDVVLGKAQAEGCEILFPKTAIGDKGFVAEIKDSEGNRIALQSLA